MKDLAFILIGTFQGLMGVIFCCFYSQLFLIPGNLLIMETFTKLFWVVSPLGWSAPSRRSQVFLFSVTFLEGEANQLDSLEEDWSGK